MVESNYYEVTYGVHGRKFHNLGKTHKQLACGKTLVLDQGIMMYVCQTTLVQIGHIARKPLGDPATQLLLLGHVVDRMYVAWFGVRAEGAEDKHN